MPAVCRSGRRVFGLHRPVHPQRERVRHLIQRLPRSCRCRRPAAQAGDSLLGRSDLDRAGPDRANPDQRAAGPLATARRACLKHGYRDGSQHKTRGNARQQHPVMRALPGPGHSTHRQARYHRQRGASTAARPAHTTTSRCRPQAGIQPPAQPASGPIRTAPHLRESSSATRIVAPPAYCATQHGTTRHETPCDRRHTDVPTKMLTKWLAKAPCSRQTRRSPAINDGVDDGIRTHDIQDHNLAL